MGRIKPKKDIPFKPSQLNPLSNVNENNPYSFQRHFKKGPRQEDTSELIRPNNTANLTMTKNENQGPVRGIHSGLTNNLNGNYNYKPAEDRNRNVDIQTREAMNSQLKESPIFKTGKKIVNHVSQNQNNIYQQEYNAFKDDPLTSGQNAKWHKKSNPSNVSEELNNLLQTRGRELEYQRAMDVFFNLESVQPKPGLRHQNNVSNVSHVFSKDIPDQAFPRPGKKILGGPQNDFNMISNDKKAPYLVENRNNGDNYKLQENTKKYITPEERQKALDVFFNLEQENPNPLKTNTQSKRTSISNTSTTPNRAGTQNSFERNKNHI